MPWISLPVGLVYAVAYILEILHYAIGTDPVITRNEMVKVIQSIKTSNSKLICNWPYDMAQILTLKTNLGYESSLL